MSQRSKRKEEHLALTQMFFNAQKTNSFDQVHLLRPALPESRVDAGSIKSSWFGKELAAPFFINAMTGGSEKSRQINQQLGQIAAKRGLALALGSASILTKEADQLESFYVAREADPDGLLIANVNPLTPPADAARIVSDLKADALQIHLNVAQEIPMPEGDRDFVWLDRMQEISEAVSVPVIVKEVGSGLDPVSLRKLQAAGFSWFDIGGAGGTNFAQIENSRSPYPMNYLNDCGLPTALAALLASPLTDRLIVSGGVRNPLDVFKG
ncbi:type 2 isopentenyl-diphosphate Delta-isomerase, partial [Lactobacillus nasalidis]